MTVEQVCIVYTHALQTLVEARHEILSRAPVAVRSGPHVVAGFGTDEKFVAIGAEVVIHQPSHRFFGAAVGRSVVVGQVEVCYAVVEGIACNGAASAVVVHSAEVVPETEAHLWQQHPAASAPCIFHPVVVAGIVSDIFLHNTKYRCSPQRYGI